MRNDDDDALISEMGMNLINLTHIVQFYIFILFFSLFFSVQHIFYLSQSTKITLIELQIKCARIEINPNLQTT